MSNNYETVTVMDTIPTSAIKPLHLALLTALAYSVVDFSTAGQPASSYIFGKDPLSTFDTEGLDDEVDAEADRAHPLFQQAISGEMEVSLADILQDILKGLDPAQYPHVDVMASYTGSSPRAGDHGGYSMRVYRDAVKHQSTQGLFNEWEGEDGRIHDLDTMCLALSGHADPAVVAAVARITDYIINHPALEGEDDGDVPAIKTAAFSD